MVVWINKRRDEGFDLGFDLGSDLQIRTKRVERSFTLRIPAV